MIKHHIKINKPKEWRDIMNINKEIITHFEYLGFAFVPDEDKVIVMKPGLPTIELIPISNDQLVVGGVYPFNDNARSNECGFLRYINTLNLHSLVTTFTKLENNLCFYTAYNGPYDRIAFGQFLQKYENDITDLLENQHETHLFITEECPRIDSDLMNLVNGEKYLA